MDDYSQEEWYQVFDEEYERYNFSHADEPVEVLEISDDDVGICDFEGDEAEDD